MAASHEQKAGPSGYDPIAGTLHGVPLWKLFIDKRCHSRGEDVFDQSSAGGSAIKAEPGYKKAMTAAFDYVLKNLGKKLDAEEFKKIHALCVTSVKNLESDSTDFRPGMYQIDLASVTESAQKEWESDLLITSADNSNLGSYLSFRVESRVSSIYNKIKATPEELLSRINGLFSDYYAQMAQAERNSIKLGLIISLCRQLEISHFFTDANQRTIVFVILNKLLLENNFLPTILEEPNVFDGYLSIEELSEAVRKGQLHFQQLMSQAAESSTTKKLFGQMPPGTPAVEAPEVTSATQALAATSIAPATRDADAETDPNALSSKRQRRGS